MENIDIIGFSGEIQMISRIASIIFGVIFVIIGFYIKAKGKEWWIYLALFGVLTIIVNIIQFLL